MFQHTTFFASVRTLYTHPYWIKSSVLNLKVWIPWICFNQLRGLFYYRFLTWGCYFGQFLYSFYHRLAMIWDIWFLIVWVIWFDELWDFWCFFLGVSVFFLPQSSPSPFFHVVPKDCYPSSAFKYPCMQIALQDLHWPTSAFLTQYCHSFFDPLLSSHQAALSEKGGISS